MCCMQFCFPNIGLHVHRSKDGFLRQFDVHHAAVLDLILGAEHREAHVESALAANHGTNRHLGEFSAEMVTQKTMRGC